MAEELHKLQELVYQLQLDKERLLQEWAMGATVSVNEPSSPHAPSVVNLVPAEQLVYFF